MAHTYSGLDRVVFEQALPLLDDHSRQTKLVQGRLNLGDGASLLSVGGGSGSIEASLLGGMNDAEMWYVDPSGEQAEAFRQTMVQHGLERCVRGVYQKTFQSFRTRRCFDAIVSSFSWFYVGIEKRWLRKLLVLLAPQGMACLLLPSAHSVEHELYHLVCPDRRMLLTGQDVASALRAADCVSTVVTRVKWIPADEVWSDGNLTAAARALASFAAQGPWREIPAPRKAAIREVFTASLGPRGVPLRWDALFVTHRQHS